jgi:hypothetical protein
MARAWRVEYEGALYHVLSRGNQRQAIFLEGPISVFALLKCMAERAAAGITV